MKTATVYSAGPSLLMQASLPAPHGTLIGINSAADVLPFPLDWWFAADKGTLQTRRPKHHPQGVVTMGGNALRVLSGQYESCRNVSNVRMWEDINMRGMKIDWSLTAALFFAADLGCSRVEVLGVDWRGVDDCAGHENKRRHTKRWADEQQEFTEACELLAAEGVHVHREFHHG